MKHKLTLILSLGVVVAASVVAVNTHRDYVNQFTIQQAITAAKNARQAALEKAQAANELKQLYDGCQHGQQAYQMLTPSQRSHVVKPDCSVQ